MSIKEESIVDRFCKVYGTLNANNVDKIADVYDENIVFVDPLHRIEGLEALKRYMANMYVNLTDYSIEIKETVQQQDLAYVNWDLAFQHPKLNQGKQVSFPGVTRLVIREKIIFHQDFFDAAAMLYEFIPLLGSAVKWIKKRAGQ